MNGLACRQTTSVLAGRHRLLLSRWYSLTSPSPRGVGFNVAAMLMRQQTRGKKTRSSMRMEDLPQGPIKMDAPPLPPPPAEDEGPAYPTVVLQARRNMQKFENCVLLTRVGGFYELYFDQAEEYGPMLNLKVAHKKTNAGPVPMAGFPFFQLDRFLKTLVLDLNCYVAIAEEFPNDPGDKIKSNGLMHDRRVTRVITPGTLIDENFIDPYANNYVMAIHINHQENDAAGAAEPNSSDNAIIEAERLAALRMNATPIGLAWIDVSTGQFYTQSTTLTSLGSILSRVGPREVVIDEVFESQSDHQLFSVLAEDKYLITFAPHSQQLALSEWTPMLESNTPTQTAQGFTPDEVQAGSLLLQYVRDRLQGLSMKLQPPMRYENMSVMAIDKSTMRSLEIKQTIRDGTFRGSLLHAIRRTVTKGGARLLNTWLSAPSTSLETIKARQDLVEYFIQHPDLRDEIVLLLRRSHDSQRLVQKFALGRGDPDDLVALANTIQATKDIVSLLEAAERQGDNTTESSSTPEQEQQNSSSEASCFTSLLSRINLKEPAALATRIKNSIDEEGLVQQHRNEDDEASQLISLAEDVVASEGARGPESALPKAGRAKKKQAASIRDHYSDDNALFVMKPDASPGLRSLHAKLSALLEETYVLGETLRERFGAASLTLKWTPNLGHVCHVKGAKDLRKLDAATTTIDDEGGEGKAKAVAVVSSSRSTRAFHAPEWTALGRRVHQTRFEVGVEEQRLFADLRALVVANLVKLRRNAAVLDELDVAASFARLAAEHGWTRPVLHDNTFIPSTTSSTSTGVGTTAQHIVIGGRHPTVEAGLREQGRSFTKNDCFLDANPPSPSPSPSSSSPLPTPPPTRTPHGRLHLITGPNMAGKSTYLRQNALLVILAQVGSWVPATYASLPVADAVFSRVGSADNLFADQSTFMVEMLETAAILRAATPRSFVIMDEIGRGTTPEDGCAVAFAALHHLAAVNRCRALFATHYHALADLAAERGMTRAAVQTYCTDVQEDGAGGFVYVHRLRRGVNRRSHALKVARLAGLPEAAIAVAREVLEKSSRDEDDNHKSEEDYYDDSESVEDAESHYAVLEEQKGVE
ncbi:muts domain V-domain-containing protein [Annulohypoxylon truncatum]|uniref:muts domain V-domain-containing protein n=1 Tax=Annulohypoxylon truncatum TaxID=327061 RepID=UPI0020075B0B|nr:muts domain V-domain-containing protein [Annulohypoxylon truncatum]KAI1208812.1 muts domain V-domain-containing protein [Annulohypoxylon truncatum]